MCLRAFSFQERKWQHVHAVMLQKGQFTADQKLRRLHVFNHLQRFLIAGPCIRNIDLDPLGISKRALPVPGTKRPRVNNPRHLRIALYCEKRARRPTVAATSFGGGTDVTLLRTILTVGGFARWFSVPCFRATYTIIRTHPVEPLLIQHYVRKACNTACVRHRCQDSILLGIDTS